MTKRVIIDTDPGIDDAVAILHALRSPAFEVLGITTVAGNIGIERTTRNAGRLLAYLGREDVPVHAGAAAPLARKGFDTADIHGSDGLGGVEFPEPSRAAGPDAIGWMAEMLMAERDVEILALGPLTNIALLLRDHPAAAKRIGRIIAMGGAVHEPGNIGPRSEFNMAADPEAAEIVLGAGLPLVLVPLDVTRRVRATESWCDALTASAQPAAIASAQLIAAYFQTTASQSQIAESRPLHDPCVMLLAEDPDIFSCEDIGFSVDLGTTRDAGALTPDASRPPVSVALGVRADEALNLLALRLKG